VDWKKILKYGFWVKVLRIEVKVKVVTGVLKAKKCFPHKWGEYNHGLRFQL